MEGFQKKMMTFVGRQMEMAKWYSHEQSKKVFEEILQAGGEGMVAKRTESAYVDGARNTDWIKLKKFETTDCVVVGYTMGEGKRDGVIGALVLCQYQNGRLKYVGKVGTGFNDKLLENITATLKCEDVGVVVAGAPDTWVNAVGESFYMVRHKYVAEVRFMERTKDGIMRHPVFLRLRDDKKIEECVI